MVPRKGMLAIFGGVFGPPLLPVMEYSSTVLVLEYHFWSTRTCNPCYSVSRLLVLEGQYTRYLVKKSAEYTSSFGFR